MGILGFLFVGLSIKEALSSSPNGKRIALAFLLLALGLLSLAINLHLIVDVYVDINALDDVVKAYVTVYKPHWIKTDEVITYTIIA